MESEASAMGIDTVVTNMANFSVGDFQNVQYLAVIVSTHGIGEPPIASERLFYGLESTAVPSLASIRYAVLALGDTGYAQFCQAGKDFDHLMVKHGAVRILPRVDCDVDYEKNALNWITRYLEKMTSPE